MKYPGTVLVYDLKTRETIYKVPVFTGQQHNEVSRALKKIIRDNYYVSYLEDSDTLGD